MDARMTIADVARLSPRTRNAAPPRNGLLAEASSLRADHPERST